MPEEMRKYTEARGTLGRYREWEKNVRNPPSVEVETDLLEAANAGDMVDAHEICTGAELDGETSAP
jgi:hypothetical protein